VRKSSSPRRESLSRLVALSAPERRVPKLGTMKDKIWVADDWDSPETNEAIWAEFWEKMDNEE
jgi:hypothetical protein